MTTDVAAVRSATAKTQSVRLFDVFLLGPLMIWGGLALAERAPWWGAALGAAGAGTMLYNARNWLWVDHARWRNP